MFSSFQAEVPAGEAPASKSSPESPPKQIQRPKRIQIRKACDACRQARVKCDEVWPCRRCRDTGRKCGNETHNEFKELPAALREIEKLRRQAKELKAQLETAAASQAEQQRQQREQQKEKAAPKLSDAPLKTWRGVTIHDLKYGQLSLEYLIYRLCSRFDEESLFLPIPLEPFFPLAEHPNGTDIGSIMQPSRAEQDAYLDLYWQGVHVLFPVVDETLFRKSYNELWVSAIPHGPRPADRLVDIVLAVTMQQAADNLLRRPADTDCGAFFFARWKAAFALNTVDLTQVQSAIIAAAFLVCEWRFDEALLTVGLALRTAHMIGLPSGAFSSGNAVLNELGRRTWLVLASMENELALRLDRVPLIPLNHVPRLTDRAGSATAADVHWLDFLNMRVELLVLAQNINTTFSARAAAADPTRPSRSAADIQTREELAGYALGIVSALSAWSTSVPPGLHLRRHNTDISAFSTDRSVPVFDGLPLWLVRQQLALELLFHTVCLRILRPFVRTGSKDASENAVIGGPNGESAAAAAVQHAMVVTCLIGYGKKHDVLRGWRFTCNMLAEAVWTCGTFATGHPVSPAAPSARRALRVAVAVDQDGVPEADAQSDRAANGLTRKMSGTRIIRIVEWLEQRIEGVVGGFSTVADETVMFDGLQAWMGQSSNVWTGLGLLGGAEAMDLVG